MLYFLNDIYPFSHGGDDLRYFKASQVRFNDLSDWFDFKSFKSSFEQAGYPLLLAWIYQFSGASLYVYKAVNLSLYLLISITWYSIGDILGGKKLALILGVAILAATPLWYYWIFAYKDMIIMFFQSQLVLYAIRYINGIKSISSLLWMFLFTLLLVPFRLGLILVNCAMAAEIAMFKLMSKKGVGDKLMTLISVAFVLFAVTMVATNRTHLEQLGASGENRALDAKTIDKTLGWYDKNLHGAPGESSSFGLKFPILYVMGEVAGFNPTVWKSLDTVWLRGVLAIPWILFGLPFFFYGLKAVFKSRKLGGLKAMVSDEALGLTSKQADKPNFVSLAKARSALKSEGANPVSQPIFINTRTAITLPSKNIKLSKETKVFGFDAGLLLIVSFLVIYLLISWVVHDTTRWKMPSFPAMLALAGIGFYTCPPQRRFSIVFLWVLFTGLCSLIYYILLK